MSGCRVRILIISLPDAIERRALIAEQVARTGMTWSFFDGHTGPGPNLAVDLSRSKILNGRDLNQLELGCYSAHYSSWAMLAQDPDHDVFIVLEDDAIVDWVYLQDVDELCRMTSQFGLLRFHSHLHSPADTVYRQGRRRVLRYRKGVKGTLGYSIDKKTARILLKRLAVIRRPVDRELDRFWSHGLPIFALYPVVCIESYPALDRGFTSQLGARIPDNPKYSLDWFGWRANRFVERVRQRLANYTWRRRWRAIYR